MPIYIPNIKFRYQSINEILTIKEYWNLIGQEPLFAITCAPDFSQACSFRKMLMDHKNFCSPIPDETNDLIFFKSPKNTVFGAFLTIFGHFCLMGIFSKNSGSVTHNYVWTPNTKLSFRKNWANSEPILRKLTDRWKDEQTLFHRTLPTMAGAPKNSFINNNIYHTRT